MFYEAELLNLFNKGRFCESWLAATCPTLFRRNFRKYHVRKICVHRICDDIMEMWQTNSHKVKDRLSLFLAAQLLYGTVCIYQQQVQFLYENTVDLFCLENNIMRLLKEQTNQENVSAITPKVKRTVQQRRQKKDAVNLFTMEEHGLIEFQNTAVEVNLEKSIEELLTEPDGTCVTSNDLITLVEDPLTSLREMRTEVADQEIFNDQAYVDFMNFNDETSVETGLAVPPKKRRIVEKSSSFLVDRHLGKSLSKSTLCYTIPFHQQSSIELVQRPEEYSLVSTSIDAFHPQINVVSTPLPEVEIDPFRFDERLKNPNTIPIEIPAELVEPIQQQQPDIIEQMNEVPRDEVAVIAPPEIPVTQVQRRKAKKRAITYDSSTQISNKCMNNHIMDFRSTLRTEHPIYDVMTLWEIELRRNIFNIPAHRHLSEAITKQFKDHLSTRPEPIDVDIFGGMFDPFQDIQSMRNYSRVRKRTHDNKMVSNIEEPSIVPNITTTEPIIPMEVIMPQVENEVMMIVEPPQLPTNVEEVSVIISMENVSNLSDSSAKINFTKDEVYKQLTSLWAQNIHPIGMKTLCSNVKKRKYVAMIFYALMCLQKELRIKMTSTSCDNEIYHIERV